MGKERKYVGREGEGSEGKEICVKNGRSKKRMSRRINKNRKRRKKRLEKKTRRRGRGGTR
jgi:hypothetical protein